MLGTNGYGKPFGSHRGAGGAGGGCRDMVAPPGAGSGKRTAELISPENKSDGLACGRKDTGSEPPIFAASRERGFGEEGGFRVSTEYTYLYSLCVTSGGHRRCVAV